MTNVDKSLSGYDDELSRIGGLADTEGRKKKLSSIHSLFTILYFWERVALMCSNSDINGDDLRHYLSRPANAYMPLVEKLRDLEVSSGGPKNGDWVALLDRVSALFRSTFPERLIK
jgi:hypothetical protein